MEYSYKFRIYPNQTQENQIAQTFDYCPQMDGKADLDKDCDGCEYYEGLNADYEVLCGFEKED